MSGSGSAKLTNRLAVTWELPLFEQAFPTVLPPEQADDRGYLGRALFSTVLVAAPRPSLLFLLLASSGQRPCPDIPGKTLDEIVSFV